MANSMFIFVLQPSPIANLAPWSAMLAGTNDLVGGFSSEECGAPLYSSPVRQELLAQDQNTACSHEAVARASMRPCFVVAMLQGFAYLANTKAGEAPILSEAAVVGQRSVAGPLLSAHLHCA